MVKTLTTLQKIYISNVLLLKFLLVTKSWTKSTTILIFFLTLICLTQGMFLELKSSTLGWFLKDHETGVMTAENSVLPSLNIYSFTHSRYYFYCIFDLINEALRHFFQKHKKNLTNSKHLNIGVYSISIILVGKIIIWQIFIFLFVISLLYWSCLAQLHTFSHELAKCMSV